MNEIKVGVIGCGAVTVKSHLPVLHDAAGLDVIALADPQFDRTREIARQFGIGRVVTDYGEMLDKVDAVVLALPHDLHAPIGVDMLERGKHVLMEKPLANTVEECERLLDAERRGGATLSVAQVRRYMRAYRAFKDWISSGLFGPIRRFDVEEGGVYNWPVASDFFFQPQAAGGGVLMDTGAHVIDALLWWLGDLTIDAYTDDNLGGVEADCELHLKTQHGATGTVRLSRIRGLSNRCLIRCEKADVEVGLLSNKVNLSVLSSDHGIGGQFSKDDREKEQTVLDLFSEQAREWVKRIRGESTNIASGVEAMRTVKLIGTAYSMRSRQIPHWQQLDDRICQGA